MGRIGIVDCQFSMDDERSSKTMVDSQIADLQTCDRVPYTACVRRRWSAAR
jgi:hypothetical protein